MATKIGTLVVDLEANSAKFKSDLKGANKLSKQFGRDLAKAAKQATVVAGAAFAAFSAVAIKAAVDAAETTSKFNVVFGAARGEMNRFISTLKKTVPATTKELRDMTSGLQDLLVPFGILPDEAVEMNKAFVKLAADIASFNNIPITQALDNLKSGIIGQSEPLLKFGINVQQAAIKTEALTLGLIKEGDAISQAVKAQAVLSIATRQSSFAIGDAARTAGSAANQIKFLQANIKELTEQAGNAMLPTFNSVVSLLVAVTSGAQDGAGAMGFLAEAVSFPVQAFFRLNEVILRFFVTPILRAKIAALEFLKFMTKFGKFFGIDVTGSMEDFALSIMQTEDQITSVTGKANEWVAEQANLIDKINTFKTEAKAAAEAAKGLGDTMEEGSSAAGRMAARTEEIAEQMAKAKKQLVSFDDITSKNLKSLVDSAGAMAVAKNEARKLTGGVAETEAKYNALGEAMNRNSKDAKSWGDEVTIQIDTVFNDLSKGIAEAIIEWKGLWGTMKSIASEFAKSILRLTVSTLVNPLINSFKGLLTGTGGGGLFGGFSLGKLFGGAGGTGAAGAAAGGAGGAGGGILSGLGGFLSSGLGIASIGLGAAIPILLKLFQKNPIESAAKESLRDFNVDIPKDAISGFISAKGISEDTFKGIRKGVLTSPQFLKNVLLPQADATGQLDQLVKSFGSLSAFGKSENFSAAVLKASGGDFSDFNKQFLEVFGRSSLLTSQFGSDLAGLLVPEGARMDGEAAVDGEEPVIRTGELLGDVFVDRLDSLITTFQDGFTELITKLQAIADTLAAGGGMVINIKAMDAATFRDFIAGDAGDALLNELGLRRQEELAEIVMTAQAGVGE